MLTKDLVKFTRRADKVKPGFVNPDDRQAQSLAQGLLSTLAAHVGQPLQALAEDWGDAKPKSLDLALRKLLLDRCELTEFGEEFQERRWQLLLAAKRIRDRAEGNDWDEMENTFHQVLSAHDFEPGELYHDLPNRRLIESYRKYSPGELLNVYNIAQVQGLLIHAESLVITLKGADVKRLRRIVQQVRFHQLLCEIDSAPGKLTLSISGPLNLFSNTQAYGLKLANFFPAILACERWELIAALKIKRRALTLKLTQRAGLSSPHVQSQAYLPPEFAQFVAEFNRRQSQWRAQMNEDILNLGEKQYIVPDFCLQAEGRKPIYIELFHKWHKHAFEARLASLSSCKDYDLRLGVQRSLLKKSSLAKLQEKVGDAKASKLFLFGDFPSVAAVQNLLTP